MDGCEGRRANAETSLAIGHNWTKLDTFPAFYPTYDLFRIIVIGGASAMSSGHMRTATDNSKT